MIEGIINPFESRLDVDAHGALYAKTIQVWSRELNLHDVAKTDSIAADIQKISRDKLEDYMYGDLEFEDADYMGRLLGGTVFRLLHTEMPDSVNNISPTVRERINRQGNTLHVEVFNSFVQSRHPGQQWQILFGIESLPTAVNSADLNYLSDKKSDESLLFLDFPHLNIVREEFGPEAVRTLQISECQVLCDAIKVTPAFPATLSSRK